MDHNFLLHKLANVGVVGYAYKATKAIYEKPVSFVLLGDRLTDWLLVQSGVGQGDSLSPTLFAIFINDLATELHEANLSIHVGETHLPLLMYADDIVVLGDNFEKTQKQMDILSAWCLRWEMKVNIKQSQVIHYRGHQKLRCNQAIQLLGQPMEYVSDKDLGCWVNEHVNNNKTVEALTSQQIIWSYYWNVSQNR